MRLTIPDPVGESGIYLLRTRGLRAPSSPIPAVVLGGLAPLAESTVLGGLVPQTESTALGGLEPLAESTVLGGLVLRTEHAALGGLPLTSTAFHEFRTREPRIKIDGLSASPGDSLLVFLPPSPLPKAVPAAGRFRLPLTPFFLWFLPYPSRAARAPGSGFSDAYGTADLSISAFFTGDGPRRDHRFDCVRLRHAWHSNPSVVDDAPTNSDKNG